MPAHCIECRRPFSLLEVTLETPEGELCVECDASYPETLRPSLGFVPSLLRSVARGDMRDTAHMARAGRKPLLPLKDTPPADSVRSGEGSLRGIPHVEGANE